MTGLPEGLWQHLLLPILSLSLAPSTKFTLAEMLGARQPSGEEKSKQHISPVRSLSHSLSL